MLLRERYYKKQIEILDDIDLSVELDKLENEKIVGYLFYCKNNGEKLLNLYLNEKDNVVDKQEIINDLIKFKNTNSSVYKNPPLEIWLENQNEWCKSLARNISKKYCLDYDDVLSEVYFNVVRLYRKNKFLDNLSYTQTSIKNNITNKMRDNRTKLNGNNTRVVSLDTIVLGCEDKEIRLEQVVEDENSVNPENYAEWQSIKKDILNTLEKSFSKREIEQITTYPASMLPSSLFSRLARWRKKNTLEGVLGR